ncbi:MAG: ABC transporter permease [Desulfovibrio sp.]|jgi:putative ABC transport system permease protein|nr:ABC transporter permease [Desulfovibrio sp.]
MRQIVYLVKQNLKRKPFRTGLMLGGIALACAVLFAAAVLSKGIHATLQTAAERLGADIVAVPSSAGEEALSALISGNPTSFYMPASLEDAVRKVPGVQQTCAQVYLRSLDAACCVAPVALVGYNPERDFTITPWVLRKMSEPLRNDQIIVGAKVISAVVGTPAKAVGQRLIFMGKPFTVASILEPTGLGTDYTVFLTMETAYQMIEGSPLYPVPVKQDQISTILVKVAEGANPAEVAGTIEKQLPGMTTYTPGLLMRSFSGQLQSLVDALFTAGIVFSVLALALAGSLFALSVRQRMRELGLFMAIGAGRRLIFRLIVLEAVCIAGVGGLLGVFVGFAATWFSREVITAMIGNMYMWPETAYFVRVAVLITVATLTVGILGALYPAGRISRIEPYEAVRKGE